MENKQEINLEKIMSLNPNLFERMKGEEWITKIKYNKRADFLTMGPSSQFSTFYYHLQDGFMFKIDKDLKIWGIGIENASHFVKNNPEIGFYLSLFMYPVRGRLFQLGLLTIYGTIYGLNYLKKAFPGATQGYISTRLVM